MKRLTLAAIALIVAQVVLAQAPQHQASIATGSTLPDTCTLEDLFYKTVAPRGWYTCTASNTWLAQTPSGTIMLLVSGACPGGWSQITAADGKFLRVTTAAHTDVGTTGGSDGVTPSGTVSQPTFTGSSSTTSAQTVSWPAGVPTETAVSAGTPAGTNGAITAGTPAGTNSAPAFSGSAWAAPAIAWPAGVPTYTGALGTLAVTAHTVVSTKQGSSSGNVVTTATHAFTGVPGGTVAWPAGVPTNGAYTPAGTVAAPTFTGTALATHNHDFTGTALGTHSHAISWPAGVPTTSTGTVTPAGTISQPTFTGASLDNRPAYINVILCSKD
jgi:hypothetical protein